MSRRKKNKYRMWVGFDGSTVAALIPLVIEDLPSDDEMIPCVVAEKQKMCMDLGGGSDATPLFAPLGLQQYEIAELEIRVVKRGPGNRRRSRTVSAANGKRSAR